MKVNPVGIQTYQHVTRRENDTRPAIADKAADSRQTQVTITPQDDTAVSSLAVKGPRGSYAEFLSPEERQALDLLFNRFRDSGRFGPGYNRNENSEDASQSVGNLIDVKA